MSMTKSTCDKIYFFYKDVWMGWIIGWGEVQTTLWCYYASLRNRNHKSLAEGGVPGQPIWSDQTKRCFSDNIPASIFSVFSF